MENSSLVKTDNNSENDALGNLIYEIRGKQVMLDSDLARLYECKNGTKTINQAVKRHLDRFPEDFCFQLSIEEYELLRSQIGTANIMARSLPFAFTEQGVAMLATVLRTPVASKISIAIMRAFVMMRHYIGNASHRLSNVESKIIEHDEQIKMLQNSFSKFEEKKKISEIYFDGQIYDAYAKIQEIFSGAKKKLVIIDAYADKTILDIVKRLGVDVSIITKPNNLLTRQDVTRYSKQYGNLNVVYDNTFHDRYFILDDKVVYHCGASVNRIGYKTFSVNLIEDTNICGLLRKEVNKLAASMKNTIARGNVR